MTSSRRTSLPAVAAEPSEGAVAAELAVPEDALPPEPLVAEAAAAVVVEALGVQLPPDVRADVGPSGLEGLAAPKDPGSTTCTMDPREALSCQQVAQASWSCPTWTLASATLTSQSCSPSSAT